MKKVILTFTLGAMLVSSALAGQEVKQKSDDPKNTIKLNPLSLILSTFNLSYERNIAKRINLQLGAYYTGASSGSVGYSGVGLSPMVRFYLSGDKNLKGFYLGPGIRFNSLTISNDASLIGFGTITKNEWSFTSFSFGSDLGYQFLFGNIVTLDLFAGAYYGVGSLSYKGSVSGTAEPSLGAIAGSGFSPNFGIKLGVAF